MLRGLREARQQFEEAQAQPEPPREDADLSARVDQLSLEVGRLYERLPAQPAPVVVPPCRVRQPGTIGSAGYGYNWQPNPSLYYLY